MAILVTYYVLGAILRSAFLMCTDEAVCVTSIGLDWNRLIMYRSIINTREGAQIVSHHHVSLIPRIIGDSGPEHILIGSLRIHPSPQWERHRGRPSK